MHLIREGESRRNDQMVPADFESLEFWQFFVTQTSRVWGILGLVKPLGLTMQQESTRAPYQTPEVNERAVMAIERKRAWAFLLIGMLLGSLAAGGFWYYFSPDLRGSPTFFNDIVLGTSRTSEVLQKQCEFSLYAFNRAFDIYCGSLNIEGTGTFYFTVTVPFGVEAWEPKGGKAVWSVPINASYYSVAVAQLYISEPHEDANANVRLTLKDSFFQGRRGNYQVNIPFGLRLPEDLQEELSRRYEGYASSVGGLFDISVVLPSQGEITRAYPPDYRQGLAGLVGFQHLEWTTSRLAPIFISYSMGSEVTSYEVALFGSGLLFGTALSMVTDSLRDIVRIFMIRRLEREIA
jgi:hypothetical protein